MHDLASLIVTAVSVYAALGLAFGVAFVLFGVSRIDPAARRGSVGFRLLILPGCVALWPWLALRWRRGGPPPEERSPHRESAVAAEGNAP